MHMTERRIDPVVETRRQAYIERLYERSGRSCSTYSGLLLQHIQHLIEEDMIRELEGSES